MKAFAPGDHVVVKKGHPHATMAGTLVVYEPYGPAMFGWKGWRVRLDDGIECYANPEKLRKTS